MPSLPARAEWAGGRKERNMRNWQIDVRPIAGALGAEIHGVDLSADLDDAAVDAIRQAWLKHLVIFFRDQKLPPDRFMAFAERFGEPIEYPFVRGIEGHPKIIQVAKFENETMNFGGIWHADTTYLERPPTATTLIAREIPPVGGDTLFADMVAAWEALPAQTRQRLLGARAVRDRSYRYNQHYPNRPPLTEAQKAKVPPVEHPMVRRHPDTGRLALYIAAGSCSHVVDMDVEEGRRLLQQLEDFATQERFVYAHHWTPGDLVVWDNRVTLHCATGCDPQYARTMQRVQAVGERPVAA